MPTYDFRCPNGHDFEEFFLKISDAKSELPCPTCGAVGQRRMSAGGGLLFKGSGFYITDYGKDGKKAQSASKPSTTKSESTGTTSSTPAPAPTPASTPAPSSTKSSE